MDRVLSSPRKQKALVRLMSSDPSLLNGLDDDLLASITLLSDPPKRRPALLSHAERRNIQLYPEDAAFAEKKKKKKSTPTLAAISNVKRTCLTRANTVLLSPSSNATAVAATARSKQECRKSSGFLSNDGRETTHLARSTVVQREKPPPVVLLDDGMLILVDGRTKPQRNSKKGSTKKKAKRMRRQGKKKGAASSSSGSSTNNSDDESNQHEFNVTRLASTAITNDSASRTSDGDECTVASTSYATCDVRLGSRLLLDHHHFVSPDQWIPRRYCKPISPC